MPMKGATGIPAVEAAGHRLEGLWSAVKVARGIVAVGSKVLSQLCGNSDVG